MTYVLETCALGNDVEQKSLSSGFSVQFDVQPAALFKAASGDALICVPEKTQWQGI